MPRNTTVFQVFVASPSDVADERVLLEGVIAQLNQIWSVSLGVSFELLKWEANVHPSFSSDPQAAINEQIGLEYDVFIAILWGRLGTPTPRAPAGTLEEFDRAYARLKTSKTSPEIMVYFKDAAIKPSKTDPAQLQGVKDFQASLSGKGGLYSMFEDQDGFESSLRAHLSALAQKFSGQVKSGILIAASSAGEEPSQPISDLQEDDYGLLDYSEIYSARFEEMNSAMTVISEAVGRLGEQLALRAAEMAKIDKNNTKEMRRNAKRAADDMNIFADVVTTQVVVMSASREVAFNALSNALALQTDFDTNQADLQELRGTLTMLIGTVDGAKTGTASMRASTGSLPRLTKELNIAKRAVVSKLELVISEFENVSFTLNNIVRAVDRMLGAGGGTGVSS